jgi:hypothetical protein
MRLVRERLISETAIKQNEFCNETNKFASLKWQKFPQSDEIYIGCENYFVIKTLLLKTRIKIIFK